MVNTEIFTHENCPEELNNAQIRQYRQNGFLAFSNVLESAELEDAKKSLSDICQRLATGTEEEVQYKPSVPVTSMRYSGATYKFTEGRCFMQLEPKFDPQSKNIHEIESHVRKYMWFCEEADALGGLIDPRHRIRRIVENLIGANSILFQEMALVKPALVGIEKPWHQDDAYFCIAPLDAIVGVWIALDDADVENGCMHVIPGAHQDGALRHFHGRDCEIEENRLDISKAIPVPIAAGGAMFFLVCSLTKRLLIAAFIIGVLCNFIFGRQPAKLSM